MVATILSDGAPERGSIYVRRVVVADFEANGMDGMDELPGALVGLAPTFFAGIETRVVYKTKAVLGKLKAMNMLRMNSRCTLYHSRWAW